MSDQWIWVTWMNNGKSVYNGKTHKVPFDTVVNRSSEMKKEDHVQVY